jgi:hypothetical protein
LSISLKIVIIKSVHKHWSTWGEVVPFDEEQAGIGGYYRVDLLPGLKVRDTGGTIELVGF